MALVLVIAGAGFYFLNKQYSLGRLPLNQVKVCEDDLLVCQDGTVLRREGYSCSFPKCPLSEISDFEEIKVVGQIICLPPKDKNGPQTMECAMGIQTDEGRNYALHDPGWRFLIGIDSGSRVEVEGEFSKLLNDKYDSAGVIELINLRRI